MEVEKTFYIIMGRSGCGKGTQAELLKVFLDNKNENKEQEIRHITTGGGFRKFIEGETATALISKKITNEGGLNPEFLAIWNWSNIFINNLGEDDTVILDGAPRKLIEVDALESAIKFYDYKKVTVIYLNVSKDWAISRLEGRGREDDNKKEEQERKMSWFESDVLPCINLYKSKSEKNENKIELEDIGRDNIKYSFIEINGEQSVEDVNAELISKLEK